MYASSFIPPLVTILGKSSSNHRDKIKEEQLHPEETSNKQLLTQLVFQPMQVDQHLDHLPRSLYCCSHLQYEWQDPNRQTHEQQHTALQ